MIKIDKVLTRLTALYNSSKPFTVQDIEDSIKDAIISELDVIRVDDTIVGVTEDGYWNLINVY